MSSASFTSLFYPVHPALWNSRDLMGKEFHQFFKHGTKYKINVGNLQPYLSNFPAVEWAYMHLITKNFNNFQGMANFFWVSIFSQCIAQGLLYSYACFFLLGSLQKYSRFSCVMPTTKHWAEMHKEVMVGRANVNLNIIQNWDFECTQHLLLIDSGWVLSSAGLL